MAMRFGNSALPDKELWQAVIVRALMDALMPGGDRLDKSRARTWLTGQSKDFTMVCSLAGFDQDFIRDSYLSGRVDYALLSVKFTDRAARIAA
jgi:hypothetical protein